MIGGQESTITDVRMVGPVHEHEGYVGPEALSGQETSASFDEKTREQRATLLAGSVGVRAEHENRHGRREAARCRTHLKGEPPFSCIEVSENNPTAQYLRLVDQKWLTRDKETALAVSPSLLNCVRSKRRHRVSVSETSAPTP